MNRKGGTIGNIDDLAMVGYRLNTWFSIRCTVISVCD